MNWIRIAPGAEALATPLPNIQNASRTPSPGPGLASSRNSTDLPCCCDWSSPSGVRTPWLTALFRNRILAGSMKIEVSGSRWWLTRVSTTLEAIVLNQSTKRAAAPKPTSARIIPQMPAEKLLTSISKPGRILCDHSASSFFMLQPPSGPITMAPMNIGTLPPAIAPNVAMAPTTPPRMLLSYIIRPPVYPMSSGRR